ncbi:MAG: site-specific integrase [Lactobacillus johnsonii]|nr:site-specific integrase [Lactobacillus johnsonii]MDY6195738.1 site-specific integrase [Lactobacillus johnsonii]
MDSPCRFNEPSLHFEKSFTYYDETGKWSFPKLKIPHQSHADFCSTDTAGGLDNKKRRYAPRGGVAYRLFLWGFPKGATPPFGTRLCEAKCTRLCESGINVKVIQDVLGHADISTTMDIYVDVMDELKKREIASFDSYMAKSRETI